MAALPLRPPVAPMLARLADEIPVGPGWRYEPKWDGFRAVVFRDDELTLFSRNGQPLERYFPELVGALTRALPEPCVVDGEIVVLTDAGLDFEALQLRIHPAASRVDKLSKELPASFVAFDLLAIADRSLLDEPLTERRAELERLLRPGDDVMLTPWTADAAVARGWFDRYEGAGLDGVIAKREDLTYQPGQRVMAKVKHRRTADCVVGGYRLWKKGGGVGSLLLGLYDDGGRLREVGAAAAFPAAQRRELLATLEPLSSDSPFGPEGGPGGPSRWNAGRDTTWVPVRPLLVCEVAYDYLQGHRFRHLTQFVGWRPDKDPRECTFEQLERPEGRSLEELLKG